MNPGTATEYDRSKMKVNTEGLGADQNAEDVVGRREIELTRIAVDNSDVPTNYNVTTKAQLAYRNVVYDFAGTDARLLSLTNVVSFGPLLSNRYSVPFEIEYTLSNGQTKTISDLAKYSYAPNSHGRMALACTMSPCRKSIRARMIKSVPSATMRATIPTTS